MRIQHLIDGETELAIAAEVDTQSAGRTYIRTWCGPRRPSV